MHSSGNFFDGKSANNYILRSKEFYTACGDEDAILNIKSKILMCGDICQYV